MANEAETLYIGVTNNLSRRVYEHQHNLVEEFTHKYGLHKLIYYEEFSDIRDALGREKQLKKWRRQKKLELIQRLNSDLSDISSEIFL